MKYSAGNSQYNSLNMADFYSTDAYTASFPDDICGVDPAEKCSRPYKHTLQKELLANNDVKEVSKHVHVWSETNLLTINTVNVQCLY